MILCKFLSMLDIEEYKMWNGLTWKKQTEQCIAMGKLYDYKLIHA